MHNVLIICKTRRDHHLKEGAMLAAIYARKSTSETDMNDEQQG
jgi:hypothetical protein